MCPRKPGPLYKWLEALLAKTMKEAHAEKKRTGKRSRVFTEFGYETLDKTWRRKRRVIGKAEVAENKERPRVAVTSLGKDQGLAQNLYEELYC